LPGGDLLANWNDWQIGVNCQSKSGWDGWPACVTKAGKGSRLHCAAFAISSASGLLPLLRGIL
jgi:hypothetical protein